MRAKNALCTEYSNNCLTMARAWYLRNVGQCALCGCWCVVKARAVDALLGRVRARVCKDNNLLLVLCFFLRCESVAASFVTV